MTRLAINIVILPPETVTELAIKWNNHLSERHPQPISLGKIRYAPHISLLMGCLSLDHLEHARALLEEIAELTRPLDLQIINTRVVTNSSVPVVTLDISLTPALLSLHQDIFTRFLPLLTQDAASTDINDLPPISPSSVDWINKFMTTQCNDKFWPHITVGHGHSEKMQDRHDFTATRVAVFHLGNHCTCKELLFEASLRK